MNRTCTFITFVAVASVPLAAQTKSGCSQPVPLDLSGPRPVVSIHLANGRDARAMFDTGAMGPVADIEQAQSLGLVNEGPLGPPFEGMHIEGAYQSTLRGVRIGSVDLGDVSVPVMPAPLPGFAGVLSPSIFGKRFVELDLAAGTLKVCDRNPRETDAGGFPYSGAPFALPSMPVKIAGETFAAHIDTGSPLELSFPMSYAKRFPLDGELIQAGSARGHAGVNPMYKARIKGLVQVGPLTLDSPEVRFTDVVPHPNVGMPLLRQMVVTIDPAGKRAWVSLSPTAKMAP
jgi:hypothetical protein